MNAVDKKKMVLDWLEHPAWEVIKTELVQEIDAMTQKLIDADGESLQLKADIRAKQALLNKIQKYNG